MIVILLLIRNGKIWRKVEKLATIEIGIFLFDFFLIKFKKYFPQKGDLLSKIIKNKTRISNFKLIYEFHNWEYL